MLHSISLSFIIFINLAIAALILLRGGRQITNRYFAASALFVGIWSLGDLAMLHASTVHVAEAGLVLFLVAPMVTTFLMVLFSIYFPNGMAALQRSSIITFIAISLPLFLWTLFDSRLIASVSIHHGENVVTVSSVGFIVYSAYLVAHFLSAYGILFHKLRSHIAKERSQILYCFTGILLSSSLALVSNIGLPLLHNTQYLWLGPTFTTFYVATTALAIVRHRLFDIQAFVARFIAYAASLGLLAAGFGLLVFGFTKLIFHLDISIGIQVFLSITTAFAAIVFDRLKRFFDRVTNDLFYHDAYDPQDLFDELNRLLVSTLSLDKLSQGTTAILAKSLKAEFCLLGLKEIIGKPQRITGTQKRDISLEDIMAVRRLTVKYHQSVIAADYLEDEKYAELKAILQKNNIAVLVRLTPSLARNEEGLGYVVLGPKKSGNPYTHEDFRVLDTVANELIIAIQNALHFEEIQNFNLTLQQKVVEATNKLRRTNEKLKALDETKDDFISMASHQLRTPLTSVKGYMSLVLDGDAGPIKKEQRMLLNQAFISSQRMVYLISDLLNVSRLKTGKFIIESAPVNLSEVITDEISQLKETAGSRSIELKYDKPHDFPEVMLDETKIRQVIMNFMDNAIYYTPAGGTVRVELIDKPTTIELRIIDDGIGVPKSEQHHLFTKFYRAGNARKARPDGTGLGLYMAKKVISAHGGALLFDSQEGQGSTFGFTFSKSKLAEAASQPAQIT